METTGDLWAMIVKAGPMRSILVASFIIILIGPTALTYNPLWAQTVSFPIIHMQDTTVTFGSLVYSGRQINAEYVSGTSQLIGDQIDSITLSLQRIGSPIGTAQIGIFNEDLSVKKLFGTVDVTSISTTFTDYEFKLSGTDLYTIQSGDRIGIKYTGGSGGNGVNVMIDRNNADPFDGTNSQRIRYESAWLYYDTGEDMYMILKQTHDGTGDATPPIINASPLGGTYYSAQSVNLSSNENPTTIYYTTDGSDPTSSGTRILYVVPIAISTTTTLKYYGFDEIGNPSVPAIQNYQILPPTSVILNVNTADLAGLPIEDIYVTISEGNAFLFAGNTPVSYSATSGTTYTVGTSLEEILQGVSYTFDHWENGSTSRTRNVTPTSSTTDVTAFYKANTAGWATVTVNSAHLSGQPLSGISVTITPSIRNIASGDTPLAYTLASDTSYTLTPQDYGSYVFDHWENGSTARIRSFTPTDPMNLVAYFRTLPTTAETTSPLVVISSPSTSQTLTSSSPTLSGTASDNVGVTMVEVSVDGGAYESADGLTRWSFSMMGLSDGLHNATVRVSDIAGNSQIATVNFSVNVDLILTKTGVYVPLYLYPSPANMNQYNIITAAKLAHPSVPIVVTLNPSGHPGSAIDSNYANAIDNLQTAGVVVIGYVPTIYGSRDMNAVKSDIDKYINWYGVDGIHLDEVSNDVGFESYYSELTAYGQSHGLRIILGNAGTDVPQSYVGTVDSIGITEGPGYVPQAWLQYCILCTTSGWHYNYDKNNFWMQRYNVETLDTQYVLEASKWVGLLYLTDGVSPVRWDHVPPYFDVLVATLDVP
jgi:spherulation-specific family 4 protein/chitobiase/beta-hexosaminidase-like protein/Big-like domain-containing protein